MTTSRVDPTENLDELIDAYFADVKILAASTARLLREHTLIPKGRSPGYDGRLFNWLTEMLNYGPPDGPEQAWPVILELVARAPDGETLGFIGSGPIQDLVNKSGAVFAVRVVDEAKSPRFRAALNHAWRDGDVPSSIRAAITDDQSGPLT